MNKLNYILFIGIIVMFSACSSEDDYMDTGSTDFYSGEEAGDVSGSDNNNNQNNNQIEPGMITAAEWNDLDNWGFWQGLIQSEDYYSLLNYWEMYPIERYELLLTNNDDKPIVDASVALYDRNDNVIWKTRTDNYGKAQLWDKFENIEKLASYAKINYNGINKTITNLIPYTEGTIEYQINTSNSTSNNIDIMFVVDATGSMGDELEYLKTELLDVIQRVQNENNTSTIRLGSVFYRDEGDDYTVRNFSLTENISDIYNSVNNQSADGGGDYPEAVHSALEASIVQQSWSSSAVTRIAFLILDAPPHYNSNVLDEIKDYTKLAAEKGIKIIPVSASGVNTETEFLLRILSITTNGTYTFITDDSGIGNDHLEATVGQYQVEYLNDLIVRLINKYSQI
jgi:von Willebrand factor type A domain-containing protein